MPIFLCPTALRAYSKQRSGAPVVSPGKAWKVMSQKPKPPSEAEDEKKIRGLVIPAGWDEKGRVTAIAISTHDEKEYLIDGEGKGADLFAFIREEVALHGVVRRQNRRKVFVVSSYETLED